VNDCLSLPLRQGSAGVRALSSWEGLWEPFGEGEAEGLPAGRGEGWEPIAVPAQQAAVEGRSAIWYRTRFPRPDHTGRVLVRFGGAFLAVHAWVNGRLLGSHYGYFGPFGFDLTPYLKDENLLIVCCESPVEKDLSRKRHVMGVFSDGDSRPYPGSAYFSLPEAYAWEVPVGLWAGVELEYTGPVILDWLRLRPRLEAGDAGRLEMEARLRNLDGRSMAGELGIEVQGPGQVPLRLQRDFRLSGGGEQSVTMTVTIPGARRWSPWRHGEPVVYAASVSLAVEGRESTRAEDEFGFRDVLIRPGHDAWSVLVNGRPAFLRGAGYTPGMRLDLLTPDRFEADLRLAREANLDALRVHGHVLPVDFYKKADAAGMLVIADFPLTLSYAYHASGDETRFFETAVREQVPEMVGLLHNRPSVALWVAHDDPPWIAANAELADVHAVRQNYTIDQEAKALFESLDPGRAALAASGELDSHVFLGWKEGSWRGFEDVGAGFVSEFGAQAHPVLDSPAWEELVARWPVAAEDPGWLYAGFQPTAWAEHGAGVPADHESLEQYVLAGQEYQAWLLRYAIDQLRKRKFEPCWGCFVYQLVDTFPGIGFGILDAARRPKPAYEAVREAMAASRVIIDPVAFTPIQPWGVGYRPAEPVVMRLVVVNDDPRLTGPASVRWSVWREAAPEQSGIGRLRDAVRRKSFSGSADLSLPTAEEPAVQVTSLTLPLDAEGDYRIEAELRAGNRVMSTSVLGFRVAADLEVVRRRPQLPAYLAERLVERSSLRRHPEGLRFRLLNQTRPAVLTGLADLHLDGRALTLPVVLVESGSGRAPLPKRLDLPVGRPLEIVIELEEPLEPGDHTLDADLTVPGVGSGRVRVTGRVAEEETRPSDRPFELT
jgi:beta-mannosidase